MKNNSSHIVAIHGLNVNPEIMHELLVDLKLNEHPNTIVSLTGHRPTTLPQERKHRLTKLNYSDWIDDFEKAFEPILKSENKIIVIGYSLGALVALEYFRIHPEHKPTKFILFAPALSFKSWTRTWKIFNSWKNLRIPSFQPKDHRSNKSIPINSYKQLFLLNLKLVKANLDNLNIPTVVFMNKKDEMVSCKGINRFISDHKLNRWQLVLINPSEAKYGKRHLIISRKVYSPESWNIMTNRIHELLTP